MKRRSFLKTSSMLLASLAGSTGCMSTKTKKQPLNILLFYTDDVGFGDLSCYGAKKIPTPNLDRLAKDGLLFRNAYCTSATCTPSRFGMLTGIYPWRKRGTGILRGDAKMIIDPKQITLPSVLQTAGYKTGVIGKWHLGLGNGHINWNKEIKPGPREIGFDYSFLIPATGDRVPCVFVEDQQVVNLDSNDPISVSYRKPFPGIPTGRKNPKLCTKMRSSHGHNQAIVNGIGRIGYMKGGKKALWIDEEIAPTLVKKAQGFIKDAKGKPFFLYLSTHDIHVPRVPNPMFVGKSGCGPRGDAMVEADWMLGEMVKTLKKLNLDQNTLIVFSSDNGPVLDDGYRDNANKQRNGHNPAGVLRAGKYSIFEGGTRIPLITWCPSQITPGISHALISQVDFLTSFAKIAGAKVPVQEQAKLDSKDMANVLFGKNKTGRKELVCQDIGQIALRQDKWKYIKPNTSLKDGLGPWKRSRAGKDGLLFNVKQDPSEQNNLIIKYPNIAKRMQKRLQEIQNRFKTK